MKEGNVIGEVGFLNKDKRTASVIADKECVMYRFNSEGWEKLKAENPDIAILFYDYIIKILSKRIIRANSEIQALNS